MHMKWPFVKDVFIRHSDTFLVMPIDLSLQRRSSKTTLKNSQSGKQNYFSHCFAGRLQMGSQRLALRSSNGKILFFFFIIIIQKMAIISRDFPAKALLLYTRSSLYSRSLPTAASVLFKKYVKKQDESSRCRCRCRCHCPIGIP